MNYHLIHLMPREDQNFCFIDDKPEGIGIKSYKLGKGLPLGSDYPPNARVFMTDRYKGIQVSDLIENACNLLIVSKRVKEVIERINKAPTEYLPLSIYNHKKRAASTDYFIINPLGTFDCLNLETSDIVYHNDKVVDVRNFVLDPLKLENAPHLFRVQEDSYTYIISEQLRQELRTLDPRPTNFFITELEQVPSHTKLTSSTD
ncbi:DUF1629 domain-containing protein [Myxococcus sp. SDU36]|uniref:imm11 family protein n=1 Tax=Myxococcus sp. SDU36 TaxID=2831967 RepID=UPI002543D94B|nr:DUF1629 domain-containing protein [Myxococcus sp. SDU36]WIG94990.1 hypothetical protein KGD87_31520 [Myxococcus sp. SDU36]